MITKIINGNEQQVATGGDKTSVPASKVTAGTLNGKVLANATAVATLADKQVRNIYFGTTALVAGTDALPTGDVYFQYE